MDNKKIEYWTCPQCGNKNPIGMKLCSKCGYSAMDGYTKEELDEIDKAMSDKVKMEGVKEKEREKNVRIAEIIILFIAGAYILYQINKVTKRITRIL